MFSAADHLAVLRLAKGVETTYVQGSRTYQVKLVRGTSASEMVGQDGIVTEVDLADFLIGREQFETLNPSFVPLAGDTITVIATGQLFTVGHPNPLKKAVDNFGHDGTAWRVHTIEG